MATLASHAALEEVRATREEIERRVVELVDELDSG